jgi:maltose O-acetyltransferase
MRVPKRAYIIDKVMHALQFVLFEPINYFRGYILKVKLNKSGRNLRIDKDCVILYSSNISIGDNVWIGRRSYISGRGTLTIGDDVLIAFDSVIITEHHEFKSKQKIRQTGFSTKPVTIGNNVLVGAKSIILPGVTIGNNVVIGANSVVTKNISSNSIVAGNPTKLIRKIK